MQNPVVIYNVLLPLVQSKTISKYMASKLGNSGLSLSHIILAFKRDGRQGLESLLSKIWENSIVRVRLLE